MRTIRGKIFTAEKTFKYGEVTLSENLIEKVKLCEQSELNEDEQQQIIIPGLVDIHMHGANGYDGCTCDEEGLRSIADYEKENGVTSFCLATMTLAESSLSSICSRISEQIGRIEGIEGIYLEGPFIAKTKAGAQNPEHVKAPDYAMLERLQKCSDGRIKVITVAPELEGAIDFIKKVTAMGTEMEYNNPTVAIAHTDADAKQTREAFEAGASQVTHLYNAMTPMSHREPGVPGAAADSKDVMVELICDGIHVDPVMVRNTFKLFGADRIILISDSMEATGKPDGEYMLGDMKVIKNGSRAVLKDNADTIAGSVTNLFQCMVNAIKFGIRPEEAIAAATINPAKAIGIYDKVGSIEAGKKANLILLDRGYSHLATIFNQN